MLTSDQRSRIVDTLHFLSMLNFSSVLKHTSQSEFFVLSAIDKKDSIQKSKYYSIANIAESLHVSSPAISRTITALENRGYVQRYTAKGSRRSTSVRLTESGRTIYEQEKSSVNDFVERVIQRMGEDKINSLISLSDELLDNISKELG